VKLISRGRRRRKSCPGRAGTIFHPRRPDAPMSATIPAESESVPFPCTRSASLRPTPPRRSHSSNTNFHPRKPVSLCRHSDRATQPHRYRTSSPSGSNSKTRTGNHLPTPSCCDIFHVLREVNLLRLVVRFDLDEAATRAVVRRNEDSIPVHDRRRHVRHVVRRFLVFPQ